MPGIMAEELQVLFVDDEKNIRLTLPLMLESFGFKVTSAGTVAEALRLISERKFDVLLSDMNIDRPGDGFTVVSAMRSIQPKAVRLILTGYPDVDTAMRAMREQVDDYLVKPTEVENIVATIRSKLEQGSRPPTVSPKRLSEIINRERDFVNEKWLALTKADADFISIQLSDSERKDHVPRVLDVVIAILEGGEITNESRNVAALHGATRLNQGYSARLVLREAKLLQDAIAACIHRHLLEIEISSLIPDMVRVFGIVQTLLEESIDALVRQPPPQINRVVKKSRMTG
jgi:DNA-binding response OmpR family regulator